MAIIISDWTITFDLGGSSAFVLATIGDDLDEEVAFPWAQATDVSKPMRAAVVTNFGRGLVETSFTLGVYKTHATMATARNWLLAHCAAVPTGVAKTLTIAVNGGATYTMASTVMDGGDRRIVVGGPPKTWVQYKLRGGKFAVVP